MLLIVLAVVLCATWATGVLVVVGMCRGAAQADAEALMQPAADGLRLEPHLRLIA